MLALNIAIPSLAATGHGTVGGGANVGMRAWYEISDIATLFQDPAMQQPVTTSGQSVAVVADKSGHGHHLIADSVSDRPTFHQDGSGAWLQFSGAQSLRVATPMVFGGTDVFMGIVAQHSVAPSSGSGAVLSDAQYHAGGLLLGWNGNKPLAIQNNLTEEGVVTLSAPAQPTAAFAMGAYTGGQAFTAHSSEGERPLSDHVFSSPSERLTLGKGTQGGRGGYFAGRFYRALYAETTEPGARQLMQSLSDNLP